MFLGVFNKGITSVPTELGALTGLTELDLRENAITAVPPELGSLTSLTLMNLRDNQSSELSCCSQISVSVLGGEYFKEKASPSTSTAPRARGKILSGRSAPAAPRPAAPCGGWSSSPSLERSPRCRVLLKTSVILGRRPEKVFFRGGAVVNASSSARTEPRGPGPPTGPPVMSLTVKK